MDSLRRDLYVGQFDYKVFRYAELLIPEGVTGREVYFDVKHYPFTLKTQLKPQFDDEELRKRRSFLRFIPPFMLI